LQWLEKTGEIPGRVLAVTDVDLFVPVLTFVFGEAQLPGRCAVVSTHRLREEFYGLPANQRLLEERLIKEAVHELGHTYGLLHCDGWECVMGSAHAVERVDVRSAEMCAACARTLHRRAA
jgi:archaemetzincin